MLIIPGSENPKESIEFIKSRGWDKDINRLYHKGAVVLGIGSSFALLGKTFKTTSSDSTIEGLGLFGVHIKLLPQEPTRVKEGCLFFARFCKYIKQGTAGRL